MSSTDFYMPRALNGDRVYAHNYRIKTKKNGKLVDAGVWEWGKVTDVKTNWRKDDDGEIHFSHSYHVMLDREAIGRRYNNKIFITVGDTGMEPAGNDVGVSDTEFCNRKGCSGIIENRESNGCTCHINPPCGLCVGDYAHCPECGWKAEDDRKK